MSLPCGVQYVEWRRAYDGCPYTFAQFCQWYAEAAQEMWNDAPEVRQAGDGLWYTNEEYDAMLRLNDDITAALEVDLDDYILDGLLAEAIPEPQMERSGGVRRVTANPSDVPA